MIHGLIVALFALAAGFTASGITANIYRLIAGKPQSTGGKTVYLLIMVVAGPSVLIGNAAKSLRAKDCSSFAFWLAAVIAGYWSFVLGLFVLNLSLVL